ncbi:Alpha/beta hydrolase [Frankia sp. Hr75.2]|nr:Alpha/beta hydrolase [Frankia sp. Hr75.2]
MSRYRRDLAAARRRLAAPPAPLRTVSTPQGAVEYLDLGEGTPVLVVHGNNGGWDQAADWSRRRLGPGHRTIAVSRYGYLGSELPPGATTTGQADALAALLDALSLDRAHVVSLSAGSMAAARLALSHRDRVERLVLESPVLPAARPLRLPPTFVLRAMLRSERPTWLTTVRPSLVARASGVGWTNLDADGQAELAEIMTTLLPVHPRHAGMIFDNVVTAPEMLADQLPWEEISVPTLVVTAEDSPLPRPAAARAVVDRLPRGNLLVLPRGGHLLLGNIGPLRAALAAFLTDITPR